ncbi:MAG: transglycosylase domain-containing protein, partial [Planctomycetes bacterium]|nr:transglycosylase domain-containing protein [Planctomycetota bacterium]
MDSEGRRLPRRRLRRILVAAAAALGAAAVLFALLWVCVPFDLRKIRGFPASMRIEDRSGELLRVVPSARGEMCVPVPLSEMSPWLPLATVAVEDRRFHHHPG